MHYIFCIKKSQIWVETVIYTLIGLVIIGILIGVAKPEIEKRKDRILIEQSLDLLNSLNDKIEEVRYYGIGNSRNFEVMIKGGKISIDGENEAVEFSIESKYKYSEPGEEIEAGKINITTKEKGKLYAVSLKINYKDINLTWNNEDSAKELQKSSVPYSIIIVNKGKANDMTNIDFSD